LPRSVHPISAVGNTSGARINSVKTKMVKYRRPEETDDCENGNCRRYETRIVTEKELVPHLDEDWDLVKELRSGKIVIKRALRLEGAA
jgi:hypothetical protein